jgi:hypothetical protein
MSEAASFGNIVSSLLAVRQDYHEHLKTIPEYEAYLLVESSTDKAAGALQSIAGSPASIAAEVLDSLQFARTRFEQHLTSLPEYRALVAIDKLIKEVSADLGGQHDAQDAAQQAPVTSAEAAPETAAPIVEPEPTSDHEDMAEPSHAELSATESTPDTTTTLPLIDVPLRSTPLAELDIDAAPIDDDDIVSVHIPSGHEEDEARDQEDLLAIARGVAELSKSAAIEAANAAATSEPYSLVPPQPKVFDHDTDEADDEAAA